MSLAPGYRIVAADPAVVRDLAPIELAAATLFPDEDLPRHLAEDPKSEDELAAAAREGMLWVALDEGDRPVAFALVDLIDGAPHLEEIDVHPDHGRRGIGRALIAAVEEWAADCGFSTITLSTFRHLAWNAPFYERVGFREIPEEEWGSGLRAVRRHEKSSGLDLTKRVLMRRHLER